jgi:LPXTG-motif cell wall-anchored protein
MSIKIGTGDKSNVWLSAIMLVVVVGLIGRGLHALHMNMASQQHQGTVSAC